MDIKKIKEEFEKYYGRKACEEDRRNLYFSERIAELTRIECIN